MLRSRLLRRLRRKPRVAIGAASDIGLVRQENEDAYGVFTDDGSGHDWLLVVADGMGGFARGAEASTMAVSVVKEAYYRASGSQADRLSLAFSEANRQVFLESERLGVRMGTTCTALSFDDGFHGGYHDALAVAHIGDSRAYEVTAGIIRQITTDHTLATELRTRGVISRSEEVSHPGGHALTRAMGVAAEARPTTVSLDLRRAPQWFVLCSDGIKHVGEERIADAVRRLDPQAACDALISDANRLGGGDNSTVVVLQLG